MLKQCHATMQCHTQNKEIKQKSSNPIVFFHLEVDHKFSDPSFLFRLGLNKTPPKRSKILERNKNFDKSRGMTYNKRL